MEELTKQLKDRDDMIQKLQGELLARRESINLRYVFYCSV
jgi:hypothetical protein